MTLPERAVSRPVLTTMVFVAVVALGAVSLSRLPIDLLPKLDFPSISIFTTYEGVGPEEIETLITRPIEEAVSTVQGVDRVESFSAEGRSRVSLRFTWGTELDTALNDVRAAVEQTRDELPEDAETPIIFKFDLASFPIMFLLLSGDMDPWRLRQLAEDTISYRLERVEGVAAVEVRGGQRREIHVDLDGDRLSALGITAAEVADALRRDNVNLPAGDVLDRGDEVIVRTLGEFESLGQMERVVVAVRDGRPVRVRDLGRVIDAVEEPTNVVYVDGQPGIRLAVSRLPDANTVAVADRVRAEVERINEEIPGVRIRASFDTSTYIRRSIASVEQGVATGALLAVVVLFVFLRSFRTTAIVGVAIPIAIIATFALMDLGGFTLNMISFGGLALGVGMLVDNSIVILENIQRHREAGAPPMRAAVDGSSEVSTAIVASTMTTLCIFVPVVFMEGFAGIFFSQMAYVVSFALLCSLAVALTLVPVLASRMGGVAAGAEESAFSRALRLPFERLEGAYAALLAAALRRRWVVYVAALGLLGGAAYLARFVGVELMPAGDESEVRIEAELPVGTPLERTTEVMQQVDEIARRELPEADISMFIAGPGGFWSSAGGNAASARIGLVPISERRRSSEEAATALRPKLAPIPDLRAKVRAGEGFFIFKMLRGTDDRLAVDVRGFDLETSARIAKSVEAVMDEVPGVADVDVDREEGSREAVVRIDGDRAADLGLSVGEIGDAVSTYVLGKAATYFREGGDEFKIRVQLREEDRQSAAQLERLPIIAKDGRRFTLGDVAAVERREGPVSIRRLNQERIVTVSGGLEGRDLGSVVRDLEPRLGELRRDLPQGYTVAMGGESAEQARSFAQLALGLLLALGLVYMVMASLFESFLHPFVMLLSVPFAAIGVVVTLVATGTTFNVNSFLGAIVLVGVVVNNAIVLVDYTNLMRRRLDVPLAEAVVEAGRRRLRPILMTTLTTALGLVPVALGLSEGGELQSPLARVVVGGLVGSTLITLFFVPCLYTTLESRRERRGARAEVAGRVA